VFSAFIIALAILVSGCGMIQVNEEKDRKQINATVNGQEIKKGEVLDQYISFYGETDEYDKEILKDILDSMIEEKLLKQKAEAAGHVVNDEVRKQASEDFEQAIKDYAEALKKEAGEDADPDTDYEQKAREEYEKFISDSGRTKEEYLELIAEYLAIKNYLDELTADVTVEDKEIEEYYQEELDFQKENPTLAAYYSSVNIVTKPASRTVKHILIKLSDEDFKEISKLRQDGKEDEANALREEKLKSIEAKAQDVLKKAKGGENFDILIEKYGEDPGMESEEYKDGYKMLRDANMVEEFLEASFTMQKDEISGLVPSDYGYHIIKVYEANEDEIASLDEVREDIKNLLLDRKKSEKADDLIDQWLEEADIKKYENRL